MSWKNEMDIESKPVTRSAIKLWFLMAASFETRHSEAQEWRIWRDFPVLLNNSEGHSKAKYLSRLVILVNDNG